MKVVVVGGSGLVGAKTVAILRQGGNEVVVASPRCGVNTITGEGLKEALAGAQVVIDLSDAPPCNREAASEFFETSSRNLLAAAAAEGIWHFVALSIVGVDRVPGQEYFYAKAAQEKLIAAAGIPYTIIRSTQFLEFVGSIADANTDGGAIRLAPSLFQPIAADDVAAIMADAVFADPENGIAEINHAAKRAAPGHGRHEMNNGPDIRADLSTKGNRL